MYDIIIVGAGTAGLSAAINSISIICSIILMVTILVIML